MDSQAQVSLVPLLPSAQQYGSHDPTYYGQQNTPYSTYLEAAPRQLPEITTYAPAQGPVGSKVTVYLRSPYDFDAPQVTAYIMFGQKRCESVLSKTLQHQPDHAYNYALSAQVPPLALTGSASPTPLYLVLDNPTVGWESASLGFGSFTYLDLPVYYPAQSPEPAPRKRKLSPESSPGRSPVKKASFQHLVRKTEHASGHISSPDPSFRRPSVPDTNSQSRRYSSEYQPAYNAPVSAAQASQYYGVPTGQSAISLHPSNTPSWAYHHNLQRTSPSPSTSMSVGRKSSQLLPSPASSAPPLIRTSTIQNSPTAPTSVTPTAGFNPYMMYPANAKAMLKIQGDLNTMTERWSTSEWDAKRRLVQFRRTQEGSIISATFEAVTLEDRIPNSICVSCIWWEERQECYVTSVDTISLLESLVAVRFTVEEKNRIRRNLEGFRPATVSKVKADSEEFFKLIMGFPNPKPRNIEKDVKVFPWRILATALKKIIGKYASHPASHRFA